MHVTWIRLLYHAELLYSHSQSIQRLVARENEVKFVKNTGPMINVAISYCSYIYVGGLGGHRSKLLVVILIFTDFQRVKDLEMQYAMLIFLYVMARNLHVLFGNFFSNIFKKFTLSFVSLGS